MGRPHGRDDVQSALIQAAITLFAERGPAAVSVREIASAAGVNHGLVHRHFGSKTGLLRAVLNHLAGDLEAAVGPDRPDESLQELLTGVLGAASHQGAWLRILAWSMLDGVELGDLQDRFPLARRMMEVARRESLGPLDPEARVTLVMSVGLGLLLFGPFLMRATDQDDARWARTRQQILGSILTSRES